ncbi:MAG: helix-turn-helix transcriptional regulator [Bacteroidia bacterium]
MNTTGSFNYQVWAPSENTANVLHHFDWIEFNCKSPKQEIAFFPGFSTGFVFLFDNESPVRLITGDGTTIRLPSCSMIPPSTRLNFSGNFTRLRAFRVVFEPGGLFSIYKNYMRDFHDKIFNPCRVLDSRLDMVYKKMKADPSPENCIRIFEGYLREKLDPAESPKSVLFRETASFLRESEIISDQPVQAVALAEAIHYSRRHLQRKMNQELGVKPSELLKINRLCKALDAIHKKTFTSLTETALTFGYYDQAHFSKEFRQIMGFSPRYYKSLLEQKEVAYTKESFYSGLLIKIPESSIRANYTSSFTSMPK